MKKVKKVLFFISKKFSGRRLDLLISSKVKNNSRSKVKFLILSGSVFFNYIVKKPSYIVCNGDLIFINIRKTVIGSSGKKKTKRLKVIYEDSSLLILNKNYNVVIHNSYNKRGEFLVNKILEVVPNFQYIFFNTNRPGIIHRLDKKTTGVIIVVKKAKFVNDMLNKFKRKLLIKKYIAFVFKVPKKKNGIVNLAIGRDMIDRKIMSVNSSNKRAAITYWKVAEEYGEIATLLEVNIRTGRTHQIRVHFKSIGFPIVGDEVYFFKDNKQSMLSSLRMMLHAIEVNFRHPISQKTVNLETKAPENFFNLIFNLGQKRKE